MAIADLTDLYPGRAAPPSADYPQGAPRNESLPGADDGTPLDQALTRDMWGFFNAIIAEAGITPSGDPDTATTSQYLEALAALFLVTANNLAEIADEGAAAQEEARDNLDVYSKEEVGDIVYAADVPLGGDFSSGVVAQISARGKQVTVSVDRGVSASVAFTAGAQATSAVVIPAALRPKTGYYTGFQVRGADNISFAARVQPSGEINLVAQSLDGGGFTAPSTCNPFTISYTAAP